MSFFYLKAFFLLILSFNCLNSSQLKTQNHLLSNNNYEEASKAFDILNEMLSDVSQEISKKSSKFLIFSL